MTILDKVIGTLCEQDAVREANEELSALRAASAQNASLRRALQDASTAFDDIAASAEVVDGDRNSYAAQVARGARRAISTALASNPTEGSSGQ